MREVNFSQNLLSNFFSKTDHKSPSFPFIFQTSAQLKLGVYLHVGAYKKFFPKDWIFIWLVTYEPWALHWLFMVYKNGYMRLINVNYFSFMRDSNFILKFIMVSFKNSKNKKKIKKNNVQFACEGEVNSHNSYTKTYYYLHHKQQ